MTDICYKTKPWDHQVEAIKRALPEPGFMFAMDMGTGKTKTTIDYINTIGAKSVLIVCPKAVIDTWIKEFQTHSANQYRIIPVSGRKPLTKKTIETNEQVEHAQMYEKPYVVVINYESVWREPFATWAADLKNWECVVADESQKIKSASSKASLFMYRLAKKVDRRLALTGTPFPHSPLDIYGQFRFIRHGLYPPSFKAFRFRYAIMGGYENHQVVKYINIEELNERFESISYRVKSEDVLDLPEQIDNEVLFELGPKAAKIYKQMSDKLVAEIKDGVVTAANAMVKLLRLQQITSGQIRPDGQGTDYEIVDSEKLSALSDIVEGLDDKEPLVVFVRFTEDARRIKERIEKIRGTKCSELTGAKNELKDFESGRTSAIVVNIQSGGAGIDLTAARYCIYYSLGFSLGDYEQSRKRLHRPGQRRNVFYYHLLAKGTVDVTVYKGLLQKKKIIDYVLEGVKEDRDGI